MVKKLLIHTSELEKKGYHFECQSTGDSKMVIRMVEYDFAISIENVKKEN